MTPTPPVLPSVEQDESCDWRALTLGLAALMAQPRESPHDSLTEVAQQLKTPVSILRAQAVRFQMHASGQPQAAAAREVAVRIVEQADLMSGWVNAMLDVQRIRLGKLSLTMSHVDLSDLVQTCLDQCLPKVEWSVDLPSVATVCADPVRLAQAVSDVLAWAARSGAGTPLALQLAVRGGECLDTPPRGVLQIAPGNTELALFDGVQSEVDLSLYVARELIRLHGGDLVVDSARRAALVTLPLDFSPRSHTVLAPGGRSSAAR